MTCMKHSRITLLSIVVALAGFLFGFDIVVISGAEQQLASLWPRSDLFHGVVIMGSALWGTVIGAMTGSLPTNRLGRKRTLLLIGFLFLISAIGSALAVEPISFALFRLIGGLGIGISTVTAPTYIAEIAPAQQRGRLVALYQFNIVLGILVAFGSNYLLQDGGANAWRWMLGVEAVPALLYLLFVFPVPESPRWLIEYRNDHASAKQILLRYFPNADVEQRMTDIENASRSDHTADSIWMKKFRTPLLLVFCIAMFNQLSGINAFLYYAPRIFELAGLERSASFLSSVGIGIVNLVFTLIGISLIDRAGRRSLMLIGSVGYIISLGLVAAAFALQWEGILVPLFFFLFIAAHAIGQGAVIWVFMAEVFPTRLRAAGQAFGSSVHWILAAAIPSLIPFTFSIVGPSVVFGFFGVMMVVQLIWVIYRMPETKNQSLENLSSHVLHS